MNNSTNIRIPEHKKNILLIGETPAVAEELTTLLTEQGYSLKAVITSYSIHYTKLYEDLGHQLPEPVIFGGEFLNVFRDKCGHGGSPVDRYQ